MGLVCDWFHAFEKDVSMRCDSDTAEDTLLAQSPFGSKPSEKTNAHTL